MRIECDTSQYEQSGAVEACWAHNPEVDGSKPSSAIYHFLSDIFDNSVSFFVPLNLHNTHPLNKLL